MHPLRAPLAGASELGGSPQGARGGDALPRRRGGRQWAGQATKILVGPWYSRGGGGGRSTVSAAAAVPPSPPRLLGPEKSEPSRPPTPSLTHSPRLGRRAVPCPLQAAPAADSGSAQTVRPRPVGARVPHEAVPRGKPRVACGAGEPALPLVDVAHMLVPVATKRGGQPDAQRVTRKAMAAPYSFRESRVSAWDTQYAEWGAETMNKEPHEGARGRQSAHDPTPTHRLPVSPKRQSHSGHLNGRTPSCTVRSCFLEGAERLNERK